MTLGSSANGTFDTRIYSYLVLFEEERNEKGNENTWLRRRVRPLSGEPEGLGASMSMKLGLIDLGQSWKVSRRTQHTGAGIYTSGSDGSQAQDGFESNRAQVDGWMLFLTK